MAFTALCWLMTRKINILMYIYLHYVFLLASTILKEVKVGQRIILGCKFSKEVLWLKDGQVIEKTNKHYTFKHNGDVLKIKSTTQMDSGLYTCQDVKNRTTALKTYNVTIPKGTFILFCFFLVKNACHIPYFYLKTFLYH